MLGILFESVAVVFAVKARQKLSQRQQDGRFWGLQRHRLGCPCGGDAIRDDLISRVDSLVHIREALRRTDRMLGGLWEGCGLRMTCQSGHRVVCAGTGLSPKDKLWICYLAAREFKRCWPLEPVLRPGPGRLAPGGRGYASGTCPRA